MLFHIFWGTPSQVGSLCNMRESVRWMLVDKTVKVFNIGDKFIIHVFKAHLKASICQVLNINSPTDNIPHLCTQQWLCDTADMIVKYAVMPMKSTDPVYSFHWTVIHLSYNYLYIDLREAIHRENGPQIIRHWKFWLPRFIATGMKNYAMDSICLLANLIADYPRHISYIITHNRMVNVEGKPGRGKPVDQMIIWNTIICKYVILNIFVNPSEGMAGLSFACSTPSIPYTH